MISDESKPKFSEVLHAAARGALEPYNHGVFDGDAWERARVISGIFDAIALVYEKFEKGMEAEKEET